MKFFQNYYLSIRMPVVHVRKLLLSRFRGEVSRCLSARPLVTCLRCLLVTPVPDPGVNLPPEAALATHGRAVTLVLGGEGCLWKLLQGSLWLWGRRNPKPGTAVQKPLPTH